MELLLAFTDVGLFEVMAWARWGATQWVQGQPRGFSDNAHFPIDAKNQWPMLTHDQFVQVIWPLLHEKASQSGRAGVWKCSELLEALGALGKVWESSRVALRELWESSGWLWEALGSSWQALFGPGELWDALGSSGKLWEALGGASRLWEALGGSGR